MGSKDFISICIPTYNGEDYIQESLESVLQQHQKDYKFEIIVIDDCSQDKTPMIIRSYRDKRLTFIQNNHRLGLVGNWNHCLSLATGDFIQIFHQDDKMLPHTVNRLSDKLHDYPQTGFVFSNIYTINSVGETIGGHWNPILPQEDFIFPGKELFNTIIENGNIIPCPTVMIRAETQKQLGYFNPLLHYTPDLEMWLRLSLYSDVAYIAEPLIYQRRHPRQESSAFIGSTNEVREVWRAFQIIFCEQRNKIENPEYRYALALNHLKKWTWYFIRCAQKSRNFNYILRYGLLLLQISMSKNLPGKY